jgi:uncharacterized membrane protein YeiH
MHALLATSLWGNRSIGDFTAIDLIAATTNAFNAALLSRRPDHYKHYTIVGIVLLAIVGGIAGGVSRDVILGVVPAPLLNPWYLILCVVAATVALGIDFGSGQRFREGLFQFATSLSLPWYAIIGANAALEHKLPYISALAIGVIGATSGRYLVDLTSGVTPKLFVRGEWFVGTAVLAALVYIVCDAGLDLSIWPATLIAFTVAFVFRYVALLRHWEEPEPWEPPEARAGEVPRPRIQDQLRAEFEREDAE